MEKRYNNFNNKQIQQQNEFQLEQDVASKGTSLSTPSIGRILTLSPDLKLTLKTGLVEICAKHRHFHVDQTSTLSYGEFFTLLGCVRQAADWLGSAKNFCVSVNKKEVAFDRETNLFDTKHRFKITLGDERMVLGETTQSHSGKFANNIFCHLYVGKYYYKSDFETETGTRYATPIKSECTELNEYQLRCLDEKSSEILVILKNMAKLHRHTTTRHCELCKALANVSVYKHQVVMNVKEIESDLKEYGVIDSTTTVGKITHLVKTWAAAGAKGRLIVDIRGQAWPVKQTTNVPPSLNAQFGPDVIGVSVKDDDDALETKLGLFDEEDIVVNAVQRIRFDDDDDNDDDDGGKGPTTYTNEHDFIIDKRDEAVSRGKKERMKVMLGIDKKDEAMSRVKQADVREKERMKVLCSMAQPNGAIEENVLKRDPRPQKKMSPEARQFIDDEAKDARPVDQTRSKSLAAVQRKRPNSFQNEYERVSKVKKSEYKLPNFYKETLAREKPKMRNVVVMEDPSSSVVNVDDDDDEDVVDVAHVGVDDDVENLQVEDDDTIEYNDDDGDDKDRLSIATDEEEVFLRKKKKNNVDMVKYGEWLKKKGLRG